MANKSKIEKRSPSESKDRCELILSAIPDIIMEVDVNKVYTWANEAGYDFFGDDVIGKPANHYFEGEQDTYEKVQSLFNGSRDLILIDSWQWRKDGEKRLLSWFCRPRLDDKGNVVGALSSARDITDYKCTLEKLSERNRELDIIASSSPDLIFTITEDGTLNFVGSLAKNILGYDAEEMMGQNFAKYIAEKELPRCWKAIEEAFCEGEINNFETIGLKKNGESVPVEVSGLIVSTDEGPLIRGALRDITERKKAEENLKRQFRLVKTITDNAGSCLFMMDENGYPTYMNPAAETVTGYTLDKLKDKPLHDSIHCKYPDGRPYPMSECAIDSALSELTEVKNYEDVFTRADGTLYPVICYLAPLELDGNVYGSVLEFRDITEQRKAQEEVRHIARFPAEDPDPVIRLARDGTMLYANKAAEQVLFDGKPAKGRSAPKEFSKLAENSLQSGVIRKCLELRKHDRVYSWNIVPIVEEQYVNVYGRDVTEQEKAEEELNIYQGKLEQLVEEKTKALNEKVIKLDKSQRAMLYMVEDLNAARDSLKRSRDELEMRVKERTAELEQAYKELDAAHRKFVKSQTLLIQSEKMNAVGELVAGVAHELNNPMMGILNYVQYCRKHTAEDDKKHAVLADAEGEIKRCVNIVDGLLTFSHLDKEGLEKPVEVEFSTILERVLKFIAHRINKEKVSVDKKYAKGIPPVVMRINRVQQVILNLINNALDALGDSEKKEIAIEVSCENDYLVITIADTGSGIARDTLAHIFEPFFTTKPSGKGTGLGLSLVKSIVEEEGGELHCKSKVGEGTRFEIKLPMVAKGGSAISGGDTLTMDSTE